MDRTIRIAKSLSDPNRVRALAALKGGELCVCQIIELLGLVPSTVSKHMSVLKDAGLVRSEKRGKWVFYSLVEKADNAAVSSLLDWVFKSIEGTDEVKRDVERLKTISCRT